MKRKIEALDDDEEDHFTKGFDAVFPNHQYGQQTTIGTIKHLKPIPAKRSRNTMTNTLCAK